MTEKVQKTPEEIEQLAFENGFESEAASTGTAAPAQTQTNESKPEPIKEGLPEQTIKTKTPEAKPVAKSVPKPKDEFVRLTKADYESLKTNAGKVPELEKRLETAFGKFGPLTQMINELKAATPRGQAVELPADVVSELQAEFPGELASGVKAALVKALKGVIGTGKSDAAPEDVVKTRFEELVLNRAREDLDEVHPKWREIVGVVDDPSKIDSAHPFRAWLAAQGKDYEDKVNNARNPTVISNAITKFQASQRASTKPAITTKPVAPNKPSKKALLRRNRIQASVQPKGLGTPPPAQKQTVEDAFAEGFRSG